MASVKAVERVGRGRVRRLLWVLVLGASLLLASVVWTVQNGPPRAAPPLECKAAEPGGLAPPPAVAVRTGALDS